MTRKAPLTERQVRTIADLTAAAAELINVAVAVNTNGLDAEHRSESQINRLVLRRRLAAMRTAISEAEGILADGAAKPQKTLILTKC